MIYPVCESMCEIFTDSPGSRLLRAPDAVQVNLSCRTILMPQNPLNGSDRDVVAVHRGSPRMS
jgi:hypothetical protein